MEKTEQQAEKKKLALKLPDTLIILFFLIVLATLCTYIIPAGAFDKVKDAAGRMVVNPASFHYVKQTPVNLFNMLMAVPRGLIEAASLTTFMLIFGAAIHLVNVTGAINAGLGSAIRTFSGSRAYIVVFGIMIVSSVLGLKGSSESLIPFVPIAVTAALAMGFDSIVGTAIVMVGGAAGFMNAFMNAAFIIAQGIAGLPAFSGIPFRVFSYTVFMLTSMVYICLYCRKLRRNPADSSMYESDKNLSLSMSIDEQAIPAFTARRKLILAVFAAAIVILILGVTKWNFGLNHYSALFLGMAIVVGLIGGFSLNGFAKEFVDGTKSMLYVTLIVGIARAISVVMADGNILDTITYFAAGTIENFPPAVVASGMMVVQAFLSIVIPSGSGQAAVTMPLMAPLSDLLGVTRQTAVLAFQLGDGIVNLLTPTSGYFMAAIAISNIPWTKWVKWYMPLCVIWTVLAMIILYIATATGYGPF